MKTLRFSVFALVLGVATVACGDDESAPAASSAKISTTLLEYVPGDTPYVFAALEPQPAALQEKFEPMLEMAVDQYHNLFLQARTAMTKGGDESASTPRKLCRCSTATACCPSFGLRFLIRTLGPAPTPD